MREMQGRQQGRFIPEFSATTKMVEYRERRVYCPPIRRRLSLVDDDGPSP